MVSRPFVVVGVPAFDEERAIARVVLEAQRYADKVVVCDDGSRDMTGVIAERLGALVVRHERNMGYGASLRTLFSKARELGADVLVTLDGDGQHDPSEIPVVTKPIIEGKADVVVGSRFIGAQGTAGMPSYRRFGVKLITKLVNGFAKDSVTDAQSGFRAYNRRALENLEVTEQGMGASTEILLRSRKQNLRICEVVCSCKYANGNVPTSTMHPVTHGLGIVISIVRFVVEEKPLLFLGVPGLLCLFVGLVFGFWMLQLYALEHQITTNIALASIAFVLLGFFMLSSAVTLYAISRLSKRLNGAR